MAFRQRVHALDITDVDLLDLGSDSGERGDLLGGRLEYVGSSGGDGDVRPRRCQLGGDRLADAGAPSGHQRASAGEEIG